MNTKFYKASPMGGISLIVLVITIIVIIILAGAVILSLTNNNPIASANQAEFKQNIDEYKSELALYITSAYSKNNGNFDPATINAQEGTIKTYISSMKDDDLSKFAIEKGELVYLDDLNSSEKVWAQDLGLKQSRGTPYTQANSAVDEGTSATTLTDNSTIDGQNPTYNDPVIPAGFFAVNTDAAKWTNVSADWNNGLVIQDNSGNQFVWVPVDGTNVTYSKWCTNGIEYNDSNISDVSFPEGLNETTLESKYGGFYIGRYEASFEYISGNIKMASKKSTGASDTSWKPADYGAERSGYLWNFINHTDAENYAENMDTSYGYITEKVGTNLVTGTQWDTIMKWLKNLGLDVSANSSSWGNYFNSTFSYNYPETGTKAANTSVLLNTGATNRNSSKNIYDIAGNLWEWTSEKYSSSFIVRGGACGNDGTSYSADFRDNNSASLESDGIGARVALYVK